MDYKKIVCIPSDYKILPYQLPYYTPGFKNYYKKGNAVQSPCEISMEKWFESSFMLLLNAIGESYFPVCRFSDGEYKFLLGEQKPSKRLSFIDKSYIIFKRKINQFKKGNSNFSANTLPNVSSGLYDMRKVKFFRSNIYPQKIKNLSQDGFLALHLSYGEKPFQEEYFPALREFLKINNINLTLQNYIPFQFVYGWLRGEKRKQLLQDRNILLIHSAQGEKKQRIEKHLIEKELVQSVEWYSISQSQAMLDDIDVSELMHKNYDIAFMGAGVGKINLFDKFKLLNIPIVDIGFVFEVWADESNKYKRNMMIPDKK